MVDSETLQDVRKRISELLTEHTKEVDKLQELEQFIESLPTESVDQMSQSASGSRGRREQDVTVVSKDEYLERIRSDAARKRSNIQRLWETISDLQEKEKSLSQ